MSKSLTVMITGVGGGGHGEQILKALRMAQTRYSIVGGDMSENSLGLLEVDHPYILPPASDPDYIDTVLRVCAKHEVIALFHGSEPELKAMSAARDRIEAQGIFLPINPAKVIDLCMDKVKTLAFLKANGFAVPNYRRVCSMSDMEGFEHLPAVLKPSVGGGGSANLFLAQDCQELSTFGAYLLAQYPEFIVQEYLGTPDSEYTVGVLLDMNGELLNSIAVKRHILGSLSNRIRVANRSSRSDLGRELAISSGISQGEIGSFPEVTEPCERIARTLGCLGTVNIQCRYVNGKVFVFEINPRFSGTTSLRAMVGYNEPDLLIRKHVMHEKVEARFPYRRGTIMRGLTERFVGERAFVRA